MLTCEGHDKQGRVVRETPSGPFDIGYDCQGTRTLSLQIMSHYFGAPGDAAALAEAQRKVEKFAFAFLTHHKMDKVGSVYEISGDVISRMFAA